VGAVWGPGPGGSGALGGGGRRHTLALAQPLGPQAHSSESANFEQRTLTSSNLACCRLGNRLWSLRLEESEEDARASGGLHH
jgi:hypothetical protein